MSAHYYDDSFIAGYKNHQRKADAYKAAQMTVVSPEVHAYLRGAHAAEVAERYGISLVPKHLKHLHGAMLD